jgi:hypothetical protein
LIASSGTLLQTVFSTSTKLIPLKPEHRRVKNGALHAYRTQYRHATHSLIMA